MLLIPAYNEEERIEPVLRDYASWARDHFSGRFKMMVLLNGCRDNTLGIVNKAASEFPCIEAVDFPDPIGKGGALIEGFNRASGFELVGYVDADGATAPKAFFDLVDHCDRADLVAGSRWIPGAILHQAQTNQRRFASRVFHIIVQIAFRMNIRDTQCGAKVMIYEVVEAIKNSLHIADMAFDINLLFCAKRAGFSLLEVPTEWTDQMGSKVVLGRTSLTMLLSVIRLWLVYSPFYPLLRLRPFRFIESWLYRKLRAPLPRASGRLAPGQRPATRQMPKP